jgi:hypothetical protein
MGVKCQKQRLIIEKKQIKEKLEATEKEGEEETKEKESSESSC